MPFKPRKHPNYGYVSYKLFLYENKSPIFPCQLPVLATNKEILKVYFNITDEKKFWSEQEEGEEKEDIDVLELLMYIIVSNSEM